MHKDKPAPSTDTSNASNSLNVQLVCLNFSTQQFQQFGSFKLAFLAGGPPMPSTLVVVTTREREIGDDR